MIDEASLKAKQANLENIKQSLCSLNEQLRLATDALSKQTTDSGSLEHLQQSVRLLSDKSLQLSELRHREEREILEQTELLQSLTSRIVKCGEEITVCGRDFDSMVSNQKPIESPLTTRATISSIVGEHEEYEATFLAPIRTEVCNKTVGITELSLSKRLKT